MLFCIIVANQPGAGIPIPADQPEIVTIGLGRWAARMHRRRVRLSHDHFAGSVAVEPLERR